MKKTFALLIIMMVLLSACQPTPGEAVIKKDEQNLDSLIKLTAKPIASDDLKETDISRAETKAPFDNVEIWTDEVSYTNENENSEVKIIINAEIDIPSRIIAPVIKVKETPFSLEEVERVKNYFMAEDEIYENPMIKTKYDYLDDLMKIKKTIEDLKRRTDLSEEESNKQISISESILSTIESKIDGAPTQIELTPALLEFKKTNSSISEIDLIRVLTYEDGRKTNLTVLNSENDKKYYLEWYVSGSRYFGEEIPIKNKLDSETIIKRSILAEGVLEKLVINNMSLADVSVVQNGSGYSPGQEITDEYIKNSCTVFHYTRNYNALKTIYAHDVEGVEPEETSYAPSYEDESIDIYINNEGIIQFVWESPMELIEVENEDAPILSLDEIKEIFIQQIAMEKSWAFPETKETINITSAQYGLTRIKIKNSANEYRYVPSWTFFGYEETTKNLYEGEKITSTYSPYAAYLTINAIDGSVIDRGLGY